IKSLIIHIIMIFTIFSFLYSTFFRSRRNALRPHCLVKAAPYERRGAADGCSQSRPKPARASHLWPANHWRPQASAERIVGQRLDLRSERGQILRRRNPAARSRSPSSQRLSGREVSERNLHLAARPGGAAALQRLIHFVSRGRGSAASARGRDPIQNRPPRSA